MPVFHRECKNCRVETLCYADTAAEARGKRCTLCGGNTTRRAVGPGARKVESLDNGLMAKAVERLADAEELQAERARQSDPLAGGAQRAAKD